MLIHIRLYRTLLFSSTLHSGKGAADQRCRPQTRGRGDHGGSFGCRRMALAREIRHAPPFRGLWERARILLKGPLTGDIGPGSLMSTYNHSQVNRMCYLAPLAKGFAVDVVQL